MMLSVPGAKTVRGYSFFGDSFVYILFEDATGVGWVYEYALVDRSGRHDLSQLRALQDWFLKYELKTVPNVSEVASIGGMVRQYQIQLDPNKLRAYNIPQARVIEAVRSAN